MNKKAFVFAGLMVLLLILVMRNCGEPEDEVVESRVSLRYLVCTNCGAQYEIPADYFENIDLRDMKRGKTEFAYRCRECGEIAAFPGMVIEMNGEVVDISGAKYDEGKGIDEIK